MHRNLIGLAAVILALAVAVGWLGFTLSAANADLEETTATLGATADSLARQEAANAALVQQTAITVARHEAANAALEQTNGALRSEKAGLEGTLAETNARNAGLQSGLDTLLARYEELDANHASLTDEHNALSDEHEALNGRYVALEDDRKALAAQYSGLQVSFTTLTSEHRTLSAELETLRGRHQSLTAELETLQGEHRTLSTDLETLRGQYQTLTEKAGELEEVEARIAELEGEIARLSAMRAPLILSPGDVQRRGFACTGSMEPVITCMDEATWLYDFDPADIVVGTTIAFHPACWKSERAIAHRVVNIQVRDGVHYFWPQGDAADEPDGCWVPESAVRAYIIEVHKDVRPDNAELREAVLAAKETFDEALDAYYALRDRYCTRGAACTVPNSIYGRLVQLRAEAVRAQSVYRCWIKNAKDSKYPGHIPHDCS